MRKRCKRRVLPKCAPTLVVLHNVPFLGISEHIAVEAMTGGYAHPDHYDNLVDCADMLLMAAREKKNAGVEEVAHLARAALSAIKDRFNRVGRLGVTSEEKNSLQALVDVSDDFWQRQSGALYSEAYEALQKFRAYQREILRKERAANA